VWWIWCGEKTAKYLKSCPVGKCVKEHLVTSVDIVCPCNSNGMHTKSFLAYVDRARWCTCCCLITDPQQREGFKIWAIFHCHGWKSIFIRYKLICCICVWASCRVQLDRTNAWYSSSEEHCYWKDRLNCRLSLQCSQGFHAFGMLHNIGWYLVTDKSGSNTLSQNVSNYQPMLCNISEEQWPQIKWSHNFMIGLINVMWLLKIEHSQWLEARVLKRWFEFYKFGCMWIIYISLLNVLAEFICQVHGCYTCWMSSCYLHQLHKIKNVLIATS
jgi:hypothetical protein